MAPRYRIDCPLLVIKNPCELHHVCGEARGRGRHDAADLDGFEFLDGTVVLYVKHTDVGGLLGDATGLERHPDGRAFGGLHLRAFGVNHAHVKGNALHGVCILVGQRIRCIYGCLLRVLNVCVAGLEAHARGERALVRVYTDGDVAHGGLAVERWHRRGSLLLGGVAVLGRFISLLLGLGLRLGIVLCEGLILNMFVGFGLRLSFGRICVLSLACSVGLRLGFICVPCLGAGIARFRRFVRPLVFGALHLGGGARNGRL